MGVDSKSNNWISVFGMTTIKRKPVQIKIVCQLFNKQQIIIWSYDEKIVLTNRYKIINHAKILLNDDNLRL